MKKTAIAAGVVIALGVVWTGAAWYTGKRVEAEYAQLAGEANKKLASSDIKYTLDSFNRSLFSSQVTESLHIPISDKETLVLSFDDNIEHGPFPVSRLKQFNLAPKLAVSHMQLVKNKLTQPIFDLTEGMNPMSVVTTLGYDGHYNSLISIRPMVNKIIHFSGLDMTASADAFDKPVTYAGKMGNYTLQANGIDIAIKNFIFAGTQNISTTAKEYISENSISVAQFKFNKQHDISIELGNIIAKSNLTGDDRILKGDYLYSTDKVAFQGQNFGSAKLKMAIDNINRPAFDLYQKTLEQQILASLKQSHSTIGTDEQSKAMLTTLGQLYAQMSHSGLKVKIAPFSWKNSKGESLYNLDVVFQQPAANSNQNIAETLFSNIKELKSSLAISLPMSKAVVASVLATQGVNAEQAQQKATEQVDTVKGLISMVPGLVTEKEDQLFTTVEYSENAFTVNGNKMMLKDFIKLYLPFISNKEEADSKEAIPKH